MAGARNWLGAVRRTFAKSSCKSVAVLEHTNLTHNVPLAVATNEITNFQDGRHRKANKLLAVEDFAAIKIQACFRGHLARRAFRALKRLVKLQALVRGVCVRRQARIAIHCMQAMVRLQVRVRARQLLGSSGEMELLQPYI